MDTISGLIELRKQVKKTMFLYVKDSDEYNMLHEMSVKLKKYINARYGGGISNEQ